MSFEVTWQITCAVLAVVALAGFVRAIKRQRETERELRELERQWIEARDKADAVREEYSAWLNEQIEQVDSSYSNSRSRNDEN